METGKAQIKNYVALTIDSPAKYGALIESSSNFNNSIYHEIYEDAKKNIRNIIVANEPSNEGVKNKESSINTTIAFVGGRGTGKSSAMASFAHWLQEDSGKTFPNNSFYSLPVIDANQLGTNETIIGRISATMMTVYDRSKNDLTTEEKRVFIQNVKAVNDIAVKYRTGDWFKTSDSLLDDTVSISKMKQKVESLIKSFLKIQSKDPKGSYVVVSIDDIDMGIENSYSIMEEIRKFLCIPSIIVLVSLDMKQLEMIINANHIKTLGKNNITDSDALIVKSLSYRYIEKLFPYERQHIMPEMTLTRLKTIISEKFLTEKCETCKDLGLSCDREDGKPSVFNMILHMIWRKTTLLPVCNSDGDHLLIPRSLRSIYNMVVFMKNLSDAIKIEKENEKENVNVSEIYFDTAKSNLDSFKKYIMDNLETFEVREMSKADLEMSEILLNVITEFPDMSLRIMNSKIVADILYNLKVKDDDNIYKNIFFDKSRFPYGICSADSILKASIYPDSISMGDVMYVIGKIDAKTKCRYINYLVEVIRTLWSIEMTKELYNSDSIEKKQVSTNFRRVVGGLIINPDDTKFCYLKNERDDEPFKPWFTFYKDPAKNETKAESADSTHPEAYKTEQAAGDVSGTVKYNKNTESISFTLNILEDNNSSDDNKHIDMTINLSNESQNEDNMKRLLSSMIVCRDPYDNKSDWRCRRYLAKPYYELSTKFENISFDPSICIHPYAVFTHILNDKDINSMSTNAASSLANMVISYKKPNALPYYLPMPLYSMDFVCRWYEVMKHYMQSQVADNYLSCIRAMFNFALVAGVPDKSNDQFINFSMYEYIPANFLKSVIDEPIKSISDWIKSLLASPVKDDEAEKIIYFIDKTLNEDLNDDNRGEKEKDFIEMIQNSAKYSQLVENTKNANDVESFISLLKETRNKLEPSADGGVQS